MSTLYVLTLLGSSVLGAQPGGAQEDAPGTKISGVVRSRTHAPIGNVRLNIVNERSGRYARVIKGNDLTKPDGSFDLEIEPTSDPIIIDFGPPRGTGFAPSSLRLLGGEQS